MTHAPAFSHPSQPGCSILTSQPPLQSTPAPSSSSDLTKAVLALCPRPHPKASALALDPLFLPSSIHPSFQSFIQQTFTSLSSEHNRPLSPWRLPAHRERWRSKNTKEEVSHLVGWKVVCATEVQGGDIRESGWAAEPGQGTLHHASCDSHRRDRNRSQRGRICGAHIVLSMGLPQDWPRFLPHHHTPLSSASSPGAPRLQHRTAAASTLLQPSGLPHHPQPPGSPVQLTPGTPPSLSRGFLSLHEWTASTRPESISEEMNMKSQWGRRRPEQLQPAHQPTLQANREV